MDIDRNKKIQTPPIFGDFIIKQNEFNPALHKKNKDTVVINASLNKEAQTLHSELLKTKKEQGLIGNLWDGFKNITKIGAGSNKVEKAIKDLNNGKVSKEEAEQILKNYIDGQKTCLDVVADIISSIVSVGAFAVSVPTGGTSLPIGLAISTGISTALKVGIKGIDAKTNGREYNKENLLYDVVTGSVNGLLAPVTNGIGSSLTKTIGCKLGLEITGDVLEAGAKNTLKNLIVNQSIDVAGGTLKQRALALGAGMAIDGALGGAADNTAREIIENKKDKNVLNAAFEGFIGGLIMSPLVGGGFRLAGKLGSKIGKKLFPNTNKTPDLPNNPFNEDMKLDVQPEPHVRPSADPKPKQVATGEPNAVETKNTVKTKEVTSNNTVKSVTKESVLLKLDRTNIPDNIKTDLKRYLDKQERIDVMDKFLSNSKLYENEWLQEKLSILLLYTNTTEKARIVDKFFSDPNLFENKKLQKKIPNLVFNSIKPEKASIVEKFLSDPKLFENEMLQEDLLCILSFTFSSQSAQAKIAVIDKYLSDPKLYESRWLQESLGDILRTTSTPEIAQDKIALIDKYLSDSKFYEKEWLQETLGVSKLDGTEIQYSSLIEDKFFSDPELLKNKELRKNISRIVVSTSTPEKFTIADKFLSNPKLYENEGLQNNISDIISKTSTPERFTIADKFLSDPNLFENEGLQKNISVIISETSTPEKVAIVDKFLSDPNLFENEGLQKKLRNILRCIYSPEEAQFKIDIMDKYLSNKNLYENEGLQNNISDIISATSTPEKVAIVDKFLSDPNLFENEGLQKNISNIIYATSIPKRFTIADKFLSDPNLFENEGLQKNISVIISEIFTPEKVAIVDKFLSDPNLFENEGLQKKLGNILRHIYTPEEAQFKIDIMDEYLSNKNLYENEGLQKNISVIISETSTPERFTIADKFLSNPNLFENEGLQKKLGDILRYIYSPEEAQFKIDIMDKYLSNKNLYENEELQKSISDIISKTSTPERFTIADKFLSDPNLFENEGLQKNISDIISETSTPEKYALAKKVLFDIANNETTAEIGVTALENYGKVSYRQIQNLEKTIGSELFNKIYKKSTDIVAAINLIGLHGKNNVNEIPITEKRNVLRTIVKNNTDLFGISDEMKQAFPLIPKNQEEYCSLLPALVKSLGIEVKTLQQKQVVEFNTNIDVLSATLKNIPDSTFNDLTLSHKYPKDDFIKDTLSIINGLSKTEKQKVFDYFGFELHQNRKTKTGYSITGYPANINNGKKLAQITDTKTKEVVEALRPKVIAFSENNAITSNIPEINEKLNSILKELPELHTLLDKPQYGAHEYDVMKHSLKVMQKITQNPNFDRLNASDKKLMMLAALLHDITKAEISADPTHNFESSFDAFYITKKFNLTQDEQIKLYTLINHHEWLKHVNKQGLSQEELTKRLQSVAFDFQNDNLFEMAKIFTEADIKSIKRDDGLFSEFGEALQTHSKKIEEYIAELKKTKPILPTTKLPKASDIASKITTVNADGSTNIKGLYQKDGLIVIKYNEVEDWDALGFPKGSISRGIKTINPVDNTQIDTGNIKFIAHGLEYENQLSNFDVFALPDSDALLSVSYMERPESKYRLFRTQGVLLDVDSKYIHGGGETDVGSGCRKNLDNFKEHYLFGGERQSDRDYLSNLIKETLNLNDEEYVAFIQANQNKSMLEIEPVEAREKLIKQFALINSNNIRGNRGYNEMFISNPKVQACFAYSQYDKVGNISSFIDEQYAFLKNYAKEHNVPFIVFGD